MDEGALGAGGREGLLLAVESATRVLGVALLRGEQVLAESGEEEAHIHSARLIPAIDRLLARAGADLGAVRAYAVSAGPGSFTGLRIGLATLKGFALADGKPVVAVPTLAALALGAAGETGPVSALLDARRGEVYAAGYPAPGAMDPDELAEGVYRPEALADRLPRASVVVAGEDSEACAEQLARMRPDLRVVAGEAARARAGAVGRLGARLLAAGQGGSAEALRPRYVRRAEAEARRLGAATEPAV